jgi:outer membrane protein assembly factor BamB
MNRVALCLFCISLLPNSVNAGTRWPQFRGPNSSGVSNTDKPPVHFGPGTNEIFKISVPPGLSSPCIWEDRIFLTAVEDGKLLTICYSAKDGKRLWSKAAPFEKMEATHPDGSPAASTPATDGERVYSYFGSAGVFAYSLDGKLVWEHRLPTAQHVGDFGTGTSPIVHDGLVLVNRDMLKNSHLLALRAADGEVAWRAERPEFGSGWSTPVIREVDGGKEVLLAGSQQLKAYDLKTGAEKWKFQGLPNAACPTPIAAEGLVFFGAWSPTSQDVQLGRFAAIAEKNDRNADGFITKDEATSGALPFLFKVFDKNEDGKLEKEEWDKTLDEMNRAVNQAVAFRPGKGEVTEDQVAWKYTRGLPYVPSSLLYQGKFYMARDGGMVTCLDAKTGKPYYEQERLAAPGSYYPSPVAAAGRIYLCSNDGKFTVISAGEKPEILGRAELGERCATTAAIANDKLFIRSANHLWCFGEK